MSSAPSVAVVIPVRNGMPWIVEALASVRAQDCDLEIAIIDDGSTDGTVEFLKSLNGWCSHFCELAGLGPSAARNAGIRATRSEFLAFLDADDLWCEGALAGLLEALSGNPECGFAQGMVQNFRCGPDGVKEFLTAPYRYLNLGACLWRRGLFETVGLLDEELSLCEDLDLLMRCWEKDVRKVEVNAVTLFYRRHAGNMTRGLSGAGFGTVKAYKRRIERIRNGRYDPSIPRHCASDTYLGRSPRNQDGF
jgi:glycosyltransferase involved in cell wall biosynthesis